MPYRVVILSNVSCLVVSNIGALGTASKLPPYGPVTPPPSTTGRVAASYDANAGRLQLYDCQQSALFVSESRALQKLAVATAGNGGAVATLSKQASAITANIGRLLWDEATGIYRQYDASPLGRGHSPVISPTSFCTDMAEIAPSLPLRHATFV